MKYFSMSWKLHEKVVYINLVNKKLHQKTQYDLEFFMTKLSFQIICTFSTKLLGVIFRPSINARKNANTVR